MNHPTAWLQDALIPPEADGHFVMIPLTQGKFAIVDEADAEMVLNRGTWQALRTPWGFYAARGECRPSRTIYMHWLIAGCKRPDHVNRNRLDNRRVNLRPATAEQNNANRPAFHNNKSGFKGVHWSQRRQRWIAEITINRRKVNLGRFDDPLDAARAYNAAALAAWGGFAWLNPIPGESDPAA